MKKICLYSVILMFCILLASCSTTSTTPTVPEQPEPAPAAPKPKPQEPGKNAPKPIEGKVTIRWKNQSQETYGFDIYRGDAKEGPFVKINKEIIPVAGSAGTQKEFIFIDQPLTIGSVYYYYVESVSFAGQKESITPVTKVVAKTPITEPRD